MFTSDPEWITSISVFAMRSRKKELPNMESSQSTLVSAWMALQYAPNESADHASLFWAFEKVDGLCAASPDEAWEFILAAWSADQSNVIAENLSAGPLEDLLTKHGETVIARVEVKAEEDPTFASLLGGVWQNAMTDEVWSRVLAIRNRNGWDGLPVTNK